MKKVYNINLGGYPYTIDEDAFEHMEQYLSALRQHFTNSEGADEIVSDIEARMAEILYKRLEGRAIVTLNDVKAVIATMGTPEDFGAEGLFGNPEAGASANAANKEQREYRTGKRLFRNPDDKVVGGVCSGISAYFGIQDPVWIRITLGVMFLASVGFVVPLYFILMMVLPEAKTAADKLEMRGEPINVDNIAKVIEDEMKRFSSKINDLTDDFGKKKNVNGEANAASFDFTKAKKATDDFAGLMSKVFLMIGRAVLWIRRPIFIIVGTAILLVTAVFWISAIVGFFFSYEYTAFILNQPQWQAPVLVTSGLILIGVPLLSTVLWCAKVLFGNKIRLRHQWAGWVLWIGSMVALSYLVVDTIKDFSQEAKGEKQIEILSQNAETLNLSAILPETTDKKFQIEDHFWIADSGLYSSLVELNIEKAEGQNYELVRRDFAKGTTQKIAEHNLRQLSYQLTQKDGELAFDRLLFVPKNEKWRGQTVVLTLYVPQGKSVQLNENLLPLLGKVFTAEPVNHWDMMEQKWTMTENGLVLDKKIIEKDLMELENLETTDSIVPNK